MREVPEPARIPHDGLVPLLRARKAELGMSDEELEERAFLTRGHVSKILGVPPSKGMGASVLTAVMDALALDWCVVANAAKQAALDHLPRNPTLVRGNHQVGAGAMRRVMRELGNKSAAVVLANGRQAIVAQMGGLARAKALSPRRRAAIARLAAEARWRPPRLP